MLSTSPFPACNLPTWAASTKSHRMPPSSALPSKNVLSLSSSRYLSPTLPVLKALRTHCLVLWSWIWGFFWKLENLKFPGRWPPCRWNARPSWFSFTTALCPTTSGCLSRACISSHCWWRPSSLREDTSTGTSLLAGVGLCCAWMGSGLLVRYVLSCDFQGVAVRREQCSVLMANCSFLGPFLTSLPVRTPLSEG